jgi:hypothetical protein
MNSRMMSVILQIGPLVRCDVCGQLDCGRPTCFREKMARRQRPTAPVSRGQSAPQRPVAPGSHGPALFAEEARLVDQLCRRGLSRSAAWRRVRGAVTVPAVMA